MTNRWSRGAFALAISIAVASAACRDSVYVHNKSPGQPFGIMYDGRSLLGTPYQDRPARSHVNPVHIGPLRFRADKDTVVAFAPGRAPVFQHVEWTWKIDWVDVRLDEETTVRVKFHLVGDKTWSDTLSDSDTLEDTITRWVDSTNTLFFNERFGVRIEWEKGSELAVPEDDSRDSYALVADAIEQPGGHDPEVLNVYVLAEVLKGPGTGQWFKDADRDFSKITPAILIGQLAVDVLLGHEIGHGMSLPHTDGCPGFVGETNLMDSNSEDKRGYVTEGQTLRAHFSSWSFFHDPDLPGLHFRPGIPSFPFLSKRVGTDANFGDYPPPCWRVWKDDPEPASGRSGSDPGCEHGSYNEGVQQAQDLGGCKPEEAFTPSTGDALVAHYLHPGCAVGREQGPDTDALLKRFTDRSADDYHLVERLLLRALKIGLEPPHEAAIRARATARDPGRTQYIRDTAASRSREQQARSLRWTGQRYVEATVRNARLARQARAMRGLIVMRSRAGTADVRRLVASSTPVLAAAARRALALLPS